MSSRKQVQHSEEHYASQLALMRKGCRSTGWAARRLLDVDESAYAADIVSRVYEGLDAIDDLGDESQVRDALAIIIAGAMLAWHAPIG